MAMLVGGVKVELLAGEVILIVGALFTITVTVAEVVVAVLLSVALAVRL